MLARPTHPFRQRFFTLQACLLAASALLLAALAAAVWLTLRSEYRSEVDGILAANDGKAQKLAFRAGEVFDRANQTTLLVKYLHERGQLPPLGALREGGVLANEVTRAVLLTDERGFVVDSTSTLVALNIADEDDFKLHKKYADRDITLGPTAPNPLAGGWMIPASRRLNRADGRFAGIVTAAVDPAALLAGSVRGEAADTAIGVVGLDGSYRARQVGGKVGYGDKVNLQRIESASQMIRTERRPLRSPIDGKDRFVSSARISGYPLAAVIAVDADSALEDYRHTRERLAVWAAGAALLILGGTALLLLQVRRLQASRQQTRSAEAAFRATLEGSMDAVAILRAQRSADGTLLDLEIADCNARAAALVGRSRDEVIGRRLCELTPTIRSGGYLAQFDRVIQRRRPVDGEVRSTEPQLADRWLHHQLVPLEDGVALITRDVSERKRAERALAALAQRDALTQLSNRRHFERRLGEAMARVARSGKPLALLYLDLDGFKLVNDNFGHDAGDAVLVEVARRLLGCVRSTDTVSRLGGDEFTVILEDAGSADDVQAFGARVVNAVGQPHSLAGQAVVCTPSVGAALLSPGESIASLRQRADTAMYLAKRGGKARIVLANGDAARREPALAAVQDSAAVPAFG